VKHIGLPVLFVVVVSWTAFWLSPSSIAGVVSRVLIGLLTILMSFLIGHSHFGSSFTSAVSSTAGDILIGGCVCIVLVAFLESVVVIVLASGESTDTKKQNESETERSHRQWNDKQRRIDFVAKIVMPVVCVAIGIISLAVASG
jgi:ABC-type microcin C transport system permease subunit YejB